MANVNGPDWQPNAFLSVSRRYFQRRDGHVFALPETEDWHIDRLLKDGWKEVAGPKGDISSAPVASPDAKDAEIARLMALLAEKEREHAVQTDTAESGGRGARLDRRPGQR
jgi:hypothetical protein